MAMSKLKKGRPGPLGKWMLMHPIAALPLLPFLRFVPKRWLAVADDDGSSGQALT